jgi:single-strand DNA-binding protein
MGGREMNGVNKVILLGHVGRDPEVRHTQNNQKIVHLSLATSERWKDRATGEIKKRAEWHRVVIFDEKIGEIAERYVKKGSLVYIEGELRTRKWSDQNGQERQTTKVVVPRYGGAIRLLGDRRTDQATATTNTKELLDDDIPF